MKPLKKRSVATERLLPSGQQRRRSAPFEQWTPQLLAIVGTRLREHEEGKALLRRTNFTSAATFVQIAGSRA